MKTIKITALIISLSIFALGNSECGNKQVEGNKTAFEEQTRTETNQQHLNEIQPAPRLQWSLERDNLIKRFKLMNDRSVFMYMYIFNYGIAEPIGYYQVNKVSSVNSQLTNTEQIVDAGGSGGYHYTVLPSPAEDGSYGTNGNGVFGFTPEDIYIEHNMQYIVSTAPLSFEKQPRKLADISAKDIEDVKKIMEKIGK